MRKVFAIAILLISSSVLITAMNQGFINKIKQDRYFDHLTPGNAASASLYHRFFIRSDRWGYGDLYGICYLPQYRFKLIPFKTYNNTVNKIATNRVLYLIGDSFTADKTLDNAFEGFDQVVFLDRRFPFGPIHIDTTKQNYLVMEFSELNISNYSAKKSFEVFNDTPATLTYVKPVSIMDRLGNILFNKDLNKNLELLLFDDKVFTPAKQLKASFNYNVLGRLPKEVAVSTKKDRLLLNSTVDAGSIQSVFKPLTDQQVDSITNDIAADQRRYLSIGFKKVFLSLIPNAVSVYDTKRSSYNYLIERIEAKTSFPKIPLYSIFKADKRNLYSLGDAHWNTEGFEIWVTETNKALKANLN